jgi:hypothetical protein
MKSARGILIFFVRFIVASIILYLVYVKFGRYYARLVAYIAKPLVSLFGFSIDIEKVVAATEDISLNPVVFLSLVAAAGGIPIKKRLGAAALGVVILTVLNSVTIFLSFLSYYHKSERLWTGTEFFNLTINFFVPLLLWFLLLPIKSLFPLRRSSR